VCLRHGLFQAWSLTKMWSPRLKHIEFKIAFLLQGISYSETWLISR